MKKALLCLFFVFFSLVVSAQGSRTPKTEFGQMYLPVWIEAKEHCLAVAKAMPEEHFDYKPTQVSKTFAEQIVHIAYTIPLLTKRYVQGMEVEVIRPDPATMSKEEIIQLLEEGFDYTTEVIYSIEQSQLDETTVMFHSGNTVSRTFAFFYVHDHMTNHRAKSNLYVRMQGIQPPEYTW